MSSPHNTDNSGGGDLDSMHGALAMMISTDEPNVLKGHMKQKGVFSTYKRHFFVLNTESGVFSKYKKNGNDAATEVIRVNETTNVQIMPGMNLSGKPNTIAVFRKGHSPMILFAESESEYQVWLQALELVNAGKQNVIAFMNSNGGADGVNNNNANSAHNNTDTDATDNMDGDQASLHQQNLAKKNKASLLSALEAVLDCAVISDDRGTIVGFNKAAEQMFGWDRAEILGENVKVLMPDYYATYHDSFMTKYYHTGHKKLIGIPRNLIAKHKNGSTFSLSLSLGEVTSQSQQSTNSFGSGGNSGRGFSSPNTASTSTTARGSSGDIAFIALFRYATSNNENKASNGGSSGGDSENSMMNDVTLGQDLSEEFKNAKESALKTSKQLMKSYESKLMGVYDEMQTKVVLMESKLEILEKENQRLTNRMRYQVEQEKLLQEELAVLQETPERIIVKKLLRNKDACRAFQKFCQTESKTIQNAIHFFRDADKFQQRFDSEGTCLEFNHLDEKTEMHTSAHSIYTKYIESHGVPISDSMELYFENHLATPTPTMFGPLQTEVVDLLKGSLYKKFADSADGKKVLATI